MHQIEVREDRVGLIDVSEEIWAEAQEEGLSVTELAEELLLDAIWTESNIEGEEV